MLSTIRRASRRSRRGATALVVAVGVLALAVAGCGGSGSDDTTQSAGGSGGQTPTLKAAVSIVTPFFAQIYVADALGYFDKAGVDLKITDNTGSNTPNFVASGQADVGFLAPTAALLAAKRGLDTSIIYTTCGGGSSGIFVAGKDVKTASDIDGQRIGALAEGSSTYGWANVYRKKYSPDSDIVPFQTAPAVAGAVMSGQVAAATGNYSMFSKGLSTGDLHFLVDTRDPAKRRKQIGPDFPECSAFGLKDNLQKKRDAVVAFLQGMEEGEAYLASHSDAEVAKVLRQEPGFKTQPLADITKDVAGIRSYWGPNDEHGAIRAAIWPYALKQYAQWGLQGFEPDDSTYAYDKRVDMSYFDAAAKKVGGGQ